MSGSSGEILGRIREALREAAPVPGHHDGGHAGTLGLRPAEEFRQWLPLVGAERDEQLELFAKNSADLRTEFQLLGGAGEMGGVLGRMAKENAWRRVASHHGELTDQALSGFNLPVLFTDPGYEVAEMEQCDAGISECDALVAQTGSILITSRSAGGRALSVLPPHHVVLCTRVQIVPDLPAAYELVRRRYGDKFPSLISFITGPSRTGDIERILVLGAHGPKRLTVLCG